MTIEKNGTSIQGGWDHTCAFYNFPVSWIISHLCPFGIILMHLIHSVFWYQVKTQGLRSHWCILKLPGIVHYITLVPLLVSYYCILYILHSGITSRQGGWYHVDALLVPFWYHTSAFYIFCILVSRQDRGVGTTLVHFLRFGITIAHTHTPTIRITLMFSGIMW